MDVHVRLETIPHPYRPFQGAHFYRATIVSYGGNRWNAGSVGYGNSAAGAIAGTEIDFDALFGMGAAEDAPPAK